MEGQGLLIIDFQIDSRYFQPRGPDHRVHRFIEGSRGERLAVRVIGRTLLQIIKRATPM